MVNCQRLQLLAIFLIVATLCHFGVRAMLEKEIVKSDLTAEKPMTGKPAGIRLVPSDGDPTGGHKLSDRTISASDGVSLGKIAEMKLKYFSQLDLWYEDMHVNPLILDLAGIPRERLPELQKVVTRVSDEARRGFKSRLKEDPLNSDFEKGKIAFIVPASVEESERASAALQEGLIASFGADAAEIMMACAPSSGNLVSYADSDIKGTLWFNPQNAAESPLDDLKLEFHWEGANGANGNWLSTGIEIRNTFGDTFNDLLKGPR